MVKLIIDDWSDSLSFDLSKLKDTILLISEKCALPPSSSFSPLTSIDDSLHDGSHFFRTSDDCLRGLIIGRAIESFPSVLIYSSRFELLRKYLPHLTSQIEPWPNDLGSYEQVRGFTLMGDQSFQPLDSRPSQEKKAPVPPPPKQHESRGLVEPWKGLAPVERAAASGPPSLQASSAPDLLRGRPAPRRQAEAAESIAWEQMAEFTQDLNELVDRATNHAQLLKAKTYNDLHSIVFQSIREMGENKPGIIDNDSRRMRLENKAEQVILGFGLFSLPAGMSISDIVDGRQYFVPLVLNS
jgi:hypothetical protein